MTEEKIKVDHGFKLGYEVQWYTGFPFNIVTVSHGISDLDSGIEPSFSERSSPFSVRAHSIWTYEGCNKNGRDPQYCGV